MMSIEQAATEILGNRPGPFYILGGQEFGVKEKYIEVLKTYYQSKFIEASDVESILYTMQIKHIIPLEPQLYIIRYDEQFLSSLKEKSSDIIKNTKIIGTIVLIYQDSKAVAKCEKFLSNYIVSFEPVSEQYIRKYLLQDYPSLDKELIDFAMWMRSDYKGAKVICGILNQVSKSQLSKYNSIQISTMLYNTKESADEHIRIGVASKNFNTLIQALDMYPNELDLFIYTILNTLVELDKLRVKPYTDSSIKKYVNDWTKMDLYNMYMIVYDVLENLRSITSDAYSSIIYLFGVLQYKRIPALEAFVSEEL